MIVKSCRNPIPEYEPKDRAVGRVVEILKTKTLPVLRHLVHSSSELWIILLWIPASVISLQAVPREWDTPFTSCLTPSIRYGMIGLPCTLFYRVLRLQ